MVLLSIYIQQHQWNKLMYKRISIIFIMDFNNKNPKIYDLLLNLRIESLQKKKYFKISNKQ